MDWNRLTDDEKLIAEKAVAMARAAKLAGDQAPHGKGLLCLEQAVLDHGRELLRLTLERSAASRDEAQKKGSAAGPAGVGGNNVTAACGPAAC
jgi:hypothetical protein